MAKCTYAIGNFSEYDYSVLKSMISVVEVRTDASWAEAGEADANVVFVGMDTPEGEPVWNRVTDAVRVWCSRSDASDAEHVLKLPVRPDPLSQLLRKLEIEVAADAAGGEGATKAAVKGARGATGEVFRPADCILGYLQEIQQGQVRALLHARQDDPTFPPPELLVDGAEGRFLWASKDAELTTLCAMPADRIRGRKADDNEYQRHAVGLEERPLAQLLWLAALFGSAGKPLEGLTSASTVKLDTRVSAAGISLAPEERKLERLLMDSPRTVNQLAGDAGLAETQVFAFVNGCLALGIAQLDDGVS